MNDIVTQNLLKLLRSGVFGEKDLKIAPMSHWKWRKVYQYACAHDLRSMIYEGLQDCKDQFFVQLPEDLSDTWRMYAEESAAIYSDTVDKTVILYNELSQQQLRPLIVKGLPLSQLYSLPSCRTIHRVKVYFPFQTQGKKADAWAATNGSNGHNADNNRYCYEWQGLQIEHCHRLHTLTNKLLDHTLQNIIEAEIRETPATHLSLNGNKVEVVSNTLELLTVLLTISHYTLTSGLSLKHLVDLGIFLRQTGDKVDYVKLQTWIDKLHMKRISQLTGMLLIRLFNFTADEIPFMSPQYTVKDLDKVISEIFRLNRDIDNNWYFQQGKDIFIHASNASAMFWQVQHSAKYFRYFPSESVTKFFSSFAHSLSHIEE